MEKCNRMEFGMRLARHVILKEIKNGCKNNLALSPLSLHAVLNLVASGSTGRILEQLLSFLESESIGDLNAQSSQMMTLWKFSHETDLKKIMKELGLTMIFEKSWELTEVVDRPDLHVSDAIHNSYIEVNEEGTIAIAVTAFACALCGIAAPRVLPPSFVVDHPFMFVIKEEVSEIVLFTGAVLNIL
ncbi:hypothetical protein P3X46_021629 [Hevea brasiliensis]|uniref:Serpin domain-containing protein n=1 Tax=Hevea brasiliensis TaxID=3981 RepID=A0ABQ9LI58_HEVBR|nr:hypothetical protein P3X46_021629 [Hevea brasiliensis]